ncbi:MAG: DUF1311 domain-containing protein [Hyphomicrobiaceae bacterium]|nr:DUF1311 domain-containing protein [Hyphomicrobiaceae bacterium]
MPKAKFAAPIAMALALLIPTISIADDFENGEAIMPGDGKRIEACLTNVDQSWDETAEIHLTYANCIGVVSEACQRETPSNTSTLGMTNCTRRETLWWDQKLNDYYRVLQKNLEPALFEQLRDTQRKWIAWRDASCDFEYTFWQDGSIRNIFYSSCQLQMTADRMIDLRTMLDWLNIDEK